MGPPQAGLTTLATMYPALIFELACSNCEDSLSSLGYMKFADGTLVDDLTVEVEQTAYSEPIVRAFLDGEITREDAVVLRLACSAEDISEDCTDNDRQQDFWKAFGAALDSQVSALSKEAYEACVYYLAAGTLEAHYDVLVTKYYRRVCDLPPLLQDMMPQPAYDWLEVQAFLKEQVKKARGKIEIPIQDLLPPRLALWWTLALQSPPEEFPKDRWEAGVDTLP
jgi:hypothetical protein